MSYSVTALLLLLRYCYHTRRYDAGDHLAVYPTNDPELVEKLGQRLEADLGQIFTLTNVDGDY